MKRKTNSIAEEPKSNLWLFLYSWEQRKLVDLFDRVTRKNRNNESKLPLTISAMDGLVDQIVYFNNRVASKNISGYYLVYNGEFAYNKSTSDGYPWGAIKRLDLYEKGVLSTLYIVFSIKDSVGVDSDFMTTLFETDTWHNGVREHAAEGARNHGLLNISADDFFDVSVTVPKQEKEQEAIGVYFKHLDHLITLHQRNKTSTHLRHASTLEQNRNAWEQRKLGEITKVLSASRVHKEEWASDGVPFFRSSDVVSAFKGNNNDRVYISQELYEELIKSSGKLQQGDILITGGGSIGIPYIVPDNEPLYSKDADLIWIKKSTKHDSHYLYTYFISPKFRDYISGISHIGTIAHYTIEQVEDTPIPLPNMAEQEVIGSFFCIIDTLITLHQRKP